jgi:CelD/BcsL family acetyltransferase involved in cellulose biosynthesis
LASPYFDLRYALAAADVAPGAAVAVIRRGLRVIGFFPFQRRGGLIQPLAAPLTDYHGVIARPGETIELRPLVRALGARRFRFSGLVGETTSLARAVARPAMVADLSKGYAGWLQQRRAAGQASFLKDKRRRARLLESDHGPVSFALEQGSGEGVLDLILTLKSEQMRRTGQHDVFSSAWTRRLLRRLAGEAFADFGLRFAVLRTGERIIAAELGLQSGSSYHLWFPIYDPEFARYSPGALMTLASLEALAGLGVTRVDFGPDGEAYKRAFAEPTGLVFEGDVRPRARAVEAAAHAALRAAPPIARAVEQIRLRLDRRLDRITACEPQVGGRAHAAWKSLGQIGRRHTKATLSAGLGLAALGVALSTE